MILIKKKKLYAAVAILFIIALPLCSAFTGTSASYNMNISNINYAAYDGHSNNYNIDFSLVEQYVGSNETVNYNVSYGFYKGVDYTGYSVGGPFDISIDAPASVTASSTATATVELTNQNPDFGEDAYIEYWIEDLPGNTISSGSKTVYVGALSTVETSVSLTAPSAAAVHVYYARVTWSNVYTATASDSFDVTAAGVTPTPGGGTGGGLAPALRITQYPKNITVVQGELAYFIVEVSNVGNQEARNTVLLVENISQYWFSVEPQSIEIDKKSNESFALKFQIPADAETGSYSFSLKAVSGSVSNEKAGTLNIVAAPLHEISIIDIQTLPVEHTLKVNETGSIRVITKNNGDENTVVTMNMQVPDNWHIEDETLSHNILAGQEKAFEFVVLPHEAGTFDILISMSYGNEERIKHIAIVVESEAAEEEEGLNPLFVVVVIVASAFLAVELYLISKKSRRKSGRERRDSEAKTQASGGESKGSPGPWAHIISEGTRQRVREFEGLLRKIKRGRKQKAGT